MEKKSTKTAVPRSPDTRRRFIRQSASVGMGLLAGSGASRTLSNTEPEAVITQPQPWNQTLGRGVNETPYGIPSLYEQGVVRRHLDAIISDPRTSVNFTPLQDLDGIVTPNGLCFERHHAGVANVDPAKHRLMINGLVKTELVFTLDDLARFPRHNRLYFLECSGNTGLEWRGPRMSGCQYTHGMLHNVMYTGIALKDLFAESGVSPRGKWVLAESADAALMSRSIPLEKILDDCLVAFKMNGEALRAEQGYPLRLVVPGWEGSTWIKWLRRLEIGDKPCHQREETSKYTDLLTDGRARRFTWLMEVKSVITSPSPEKPIRHGRGALVISGLAWSGNGTIRRVDVSLDGGRNWRAARLDGPSLSKSVHRFYYELDWQGQEMRLQSRAIDEHGQVQPTRKALRAARGVKSFYHNNGIHTWRVGPDGGVENVASG